MKTGKRILSILLTTLLTVLLLALSLATAAQADADPCAGGHDWSGWRQSQAATCDSPGSQERVCNRCYTRETQTIPALGHSWNGGAVTAQPSCTSGGTRVYTCTRCGATRTEGIGALGHSYGGVQVTKPSTCASMGESFQVCSRCGDRVTHVMPKNENHSWDEGVITKEPEGFTPGEKTYTCTLCGATRTEEVEPVTGLFSSLNSLLSGGNFQNKIMSNPLGDDILHIVEQPQGGSIPYGSYAQLSVAAEGGEEPYTYEWWYVPAEIEASPSALADLINGQGGMITDTVQQNQNDVKNATIASTSEWLSKHISFDGTSGSLTGKTAKEMEALEAKPFNPLASIWVSSTNSNCYAYVPGTYWCVVYDSAGHHVTSDRAKVINALYIAVQPESKNIWGLGSATLTCRAAGGSGSYLYNWHDKDGNLLSDEASCTTDQEGLYQCIAYDNKSLDIAESNWVEVYSDEATQRDLRPVITLQPHSINLEYREDGKYSWDLACLALTYDGGSSDLRYTWFGKSGSTWAPIKEGAILTWSARGGIYRCKVEDTRTGQYVISNEAKVQTQLSCTITGHTAANYSGPGNLYYEIKGGTGPYEVEIYQHRITGMKVNEQTQAYEFVYVNVVYAKQRVDSDGKYVEYSLPIRYSYVVTMDNDWAQGKPLLVEDFLDYYIYATDAEGRTGVSMIYRTE